jgi:hypothetical protein
MLWPFPDGFESESILASVPVMRKSAQAADPRGWDRVRGRDRREVVPFRRDGDPPRIGLA